MKNSSDVLRVVQPNQLHIQVNSERADWLSHRLTAAEWLSLSKRNFRLDLGEFLFLSSERGESKRDVRTAPEQKRWR